MDKVNFIRNLHKKISSDIKKRLSEFHYIWKNKDENKIYREFVFCLLTPQSKAEICWKTVNILFDTNLIRTGSYEDIANTIRNVRFRFNKAKYIIFARKNFLYNENFSLLQKLQSLKNTEDMREWLVKNVKGYGYKEASHFLRNIGLGEKLAILDRHILKNMVHLNVIENIPKTLSKKKYLLLEKKFIEFCNKINIPPAEMDLLLWYKETGKVFK